MTLIEIERKFLIYMPSIKQLEMQDGVRIKHIEQTYLVSDTSKNARVRKIDEGGKIKFTKTVKERISVLSAYENEFEISEDTYIKELENSDINKKTVVKTRFCIPFDRHVIEIDIYPFWNDRAILEVELSNESESFSLPDFIRVIKEVSEDKRYKNTNLAECIPMDDISMV